MNSLEQAKQLFLSALEHQSRGDLVRAETIYLQALERAPGRTSILNNLAAVLLQLKRPQEALAHCEQVLQQNPHDVTALLNCGNCHLDLHLPAAALGYFDTALRVAPGHVETLTSRSKALIELRRFEDACSNCRQALATAPDHVDAKINLGSALLALKKAGEALATFREVVDIQPQTHQAHNNIGNALLALARHEEALNAYDHALTLQPSYADALCSRAATLHAMGNFEEETRAAERLLEAAPEYDYALGKLVSAKGMCCDWRSYSADLTRLTTAVRAGRKAGIPFEVVTACDSVSDILLCARTYANSHFPGAGEAPAMIGHRQHEKIRVAYLSADFGEHAVAYLTAGLFERHDRTRFDTTAISLGTHPDTHMRLRLKGAFDRFIDVALRPDAEVAQLMRSLQIDIAVDLTGYTANARTGIFAFRPAPIQVMVPFFPGTMGTDYFDYIIADRWVIPDDHAGFYAEKPVYLPDTFMACDARSRAIAGTPTRAEAGLPDRGFIFCSFNNCYKIKPPVFDVWMRLLLQVPGSVLWLLADYPPARQNLRREAQARGVSPDRIIFAPRASLPEHLARQRLADIFLDTLPVNAGSSAIDAFCADLPLLTCTGTTFVGRVATSLLNALGLPELVTGSLDEYEAMAIRLATDAALMADVRARLAAHRDSMPLFDIDRFRRNIEAAYTAMWEHGQSGKPPTILRL